MPPRPPHSVRSIGELQQYSRRTVSRVLTIEEVVASAKLAERPAAAVGSEWLKIEVLRNFKTRLSAPFADFGRKHAAIRP